MASTTLSTTQEASIKAVLQKTDDFVTGDANPLLKHTKTTASGTSADQADLLYHTRATIASSGNLQIDISGVLKDLFGNDAVLVKLKGFLIVNRSEDAASPTEAAVKVEGNFITTRFGGSTAIPIESGGHLAWASPKDGETVVASTGDIIQITNQDGSNSAHVDVVLLGTSA